MCDAPFYGNYLSTPQLIWNPSVGGADSSPWQGSQRRWLAAGEATPPVRKRHLPLKGKATAAAAAIESHFIRRKRHLPLKGKAITYLRHVSGAKRTSMGKISRRPRNMSKHRTALLIILSPETPMVKVFESMP